MLIRSAGLLTLAISLAMGAVLTACAFKANTPAVPAPLPPPTASQLQAFEWTLDAASDAQGKALAALFPRADRRFVLEFVGDNLALRGGCNSLAGRYEISSSGVLQVGPLMGTRRACELPLMQADSAIVALLAQSWQLRLEPGARPVLRLQSSQGQTLVWTGSAKA